MHVSTIGMEQKTNKSAKLKKPINNGNPSVSFNGGTGRDVGRAVGSLLGFTASLGIVVASGGIALPAVLLGVGTQVTTTIAGGKLGDKMGDKIAKTIKHLK